MPAHRARVTLAPKISFFIKFFKVLEALRMEHVRTAKQRGFLLDYKGIEANWAVRVISLQSLLFNNCPKLAKLLRLVPLPIHGK